MSMPTFLCEDSSYQCQSLVEFKRCAVFALRHSLQTALELPLLRVEFPVPDF